MSEKDLFLLLLLFIETSDLILLLFKHVFHACFPSFQEKLMKRDPRVNSYWIEHVSVCWLVLKFFVKHRFESSQGHNMREKCIEINALGSKMCLEALYATALLRRFLQNVFSCWRRKCSVAADCNDC